MNRTAIIFGVIIAVSCILAVALYLFTRKPSGIAPTKIEMQPARMILNTEEL